MTEEKDNIVIFPRHRVVATPPENVIDINSIVVQSIANHDMIQSWVDQLSDTIDKDIGGEGVNGPKMNNMCRDIVMLIEQYIGKKLPPNGTKEKARA